MSHNRPPTPPGPVRLALWASLACACASAPAPEPPQPAQLVRAISPPDRALPAEPLPGTARALLQPRMASHAQDMAQLMSAVMALRYPEIEARANHMANQAHFPRPGGHDGTASKPALPEKFFGYERSQRLLARTLASAAKERQPFQVAHAYGQLSETCVECHAVYRAGR